MRDNIILENDIKYIHSCSFIDLKKFTNKTVLITGATGLIGFTLTKALLDYNKIHSCNIKIIAIVRNSKKAKKMYAGYTCDIEFVVSDITICALNCAP